MPGDDREFCASRNRPCALSGRPASSRSIRHPSLGNPDTSKTRVALSIHIRRTHGTPAADTTGSAGTYNNQDFLAPTNAGFYDAVVNLPNGATVTAVSATVRDAVPGASARITLSRDPSGATGYDTIAVVDSPLNGPPATLTLTTTSVSNPVIDNDTYGYFISFGGGPNLDLYDASITYTLPLAEI